jgi:hypothetical protein
LPRPSQLALCSSVAPRPFCCGRSRRRPDSSAGACRLVSVSQSCVQPAYLGPRAAGGRPTDHRRCGPTSSGAPATLGCPPVWARVRLLGPGRTPVRPPLEADGLAQPPLLLLALHHLRAERGTACAGPEAHQSRWQARPDRVRGRLWASGFKRLYWANHTWFFWREHGVRYAASLHYFGPGTTQLLGRLIRELRPTAELRP